MSSLKKNWKAVLAVILFLAAALVHLMVYRPGKQTYDTRYSELNINIAALQNTVAENLRYTDIQEHLPDAMATLEESRLKLYQHFPTELLEEDQIMYVVYLEDTFGTEISFSFGTVDAIQSFSDGATLNGLTLTVNYETNYNGFKKMINYLAEDSRITSIQHATMQYDEENDVATGTLTLLCYVLDSQLLEYQSPDVTTPSTGKPNIFS